MTCLFVGNITKTATEQKISEAFREIGPCRVELKGRYAFVEYNSPIDAKNAMHTLNSTNLNGVNGHSRVRIELSKKKKVNDKLEDNEKIGRIDDISLSENSEEEEQKNNHKKFSRKTEDEPQKRNVCFICKLPGHFAKECVLTKESCYECGEKGHMAKECKAGIREAKNLTKNRVKAVFSQQSAYKFTSPKRIYDNIMSYIKEVGIN